MAVLSQLAYRAAVRVEPLLLRLARPSLRFPPLLLVGVPRSGTTVVYQHLINSFRFSYFPNLAKQYHRAPVVASMLARLFGTYSPGYRSEYGNTSGILGPSDGWGVFNRWFSEAEHEAPLTGSQIDELRCVFAALERIMGAPFINKNNSNSVRVRTLRRALPEAFFVHVHRRPVDVVLSLLAARRAHQIPQDQWWAATPPQFAARTYGSELERVVHQVWGVDRYTREALRESGSRYVEVSYEEFCTAPDDVIAQVESLYAETGIRLERRQGNAAQPRLVPRSRSERSDTDSATVERIEEMLSSLDAAADP